MRRLSQRPGLAIVTDEAPPPARMEAGCEQYQLPRNCVRIYPVVDAYLIVGYDEDGTAVLEQRATVGAWEPVYDDVEFALRRHQRKHLTLTVTP